MFNVGKLRYKLLFQSESIIETSKNRYQMNCFHVVVINRIVLAEANRMITYENEWEKNLQLEMPVGKPLSFNSNENSFDLFAHAKSRCWHHATDNPLKRHTIRDILNLNFFIHRFVFRVAGTYTDNSLIQFE